MIFISKGIVLEHSTEELLFVRRCGMDFQLTGTEAALWLNGRTGFSEAIASAASNHLYRMGLIDWEDEDTPLSRYRILTRCILCPTDTIELLPIRWQQAHFMVWLREAGLILFLDKKLYWNPEQNLWQTRRSPQSIMGIYGQGLQRSMPQILPGRLKVFYQGIVSDSL